MVINTGRVYTTEGGMQYEVDGNEVKCSNRGLNKSGETLKPKIYRTVEDGLYRVGPVIGPSQTTVETVSRIRLSRLMDEHEVYLDMQRRQRAGESLSATETNWMSAHEVQMYTWGLESNSGKLVQTNPRGDQTVAKDVKMTDLEEQIQRDMRRARNSNNTPVTYQPSMRVFANDRE